MSYTEASVENMSPAVNLADRTVLARIFQHPLTHNLSWREALAFFTAIGTVEHGHNGNVVVRLGSEHQLFSPGYDKDMSPEEVMALRHVLTRAGWASDAAPIHAPVTVRQDLVIIIDHIGAQIFPASSMQGSVPQALDQPLHQIDRAQHDGDREETYLADRQFFDAIAAAVSGTGRIVLVGHGRAQSKEADHLMAELAAHHSAVHARVAREIVTDLTHLTVPQLLAMARHALQPVFLTAGRRVN